MSNDVQLYEMGEIRKNSDDNSYSLLSSCETPEEQDFLDVTSITDADDFEDCTSSWEVQDDWEDDKERSIETIIENRSDVSLFREMCVSRGGLLNGRYKYG